MKETNNNSIHSLVCWKFWTLQNKAEIERRRRARMNASFDQLKMFHLLQTPKIETKLEKVEILSLTVKYLQAISRCEQRKGN